MSPSPAPARSGFAALVLSAEAVYGLIIVAGMIVVSRNLTGTSGEALLSVVVTLLVFFAAHVFAAAASAMAQGSAGGAGDALRHGARESAGLLLVGAIPLVVLALGVFGALRHADAVWLALAVDLVLLGALGWFIAASRTRNVWIRIGTVVLTAAFGGILIILKALVHH